MASRVVDPVNASHAELADCLLSSGIDIEVSTAGRLEAFVRPSGRVDTEPEWIELPHSQLLELPHSQLLELPHSHLPKLQGAGVIDWDRGTDTVRRGPDFEAVEAVVHVLRSNGNALPDGWP